jgi:hypothetical protein
MPNQINYPLNYKKAKRWADSQCDEESREFANSIIKHTRYISYEQFTNRLDVICSDYVKTYAEPQHKGTVFVLLLPFQVKKSNIWVTMLGFKHLRKVVTEIYYDVTDVYNDIHNHRSRLYQKKVRCIVCDDCAYTGHQLSFLASIDYSWLDYKDKPPAPDVHSQEWLEWYAGVQIHAKRIVEDIDIRQFSVDLIIPFMSTIARANLHRIHYVKISAKCKVFPIFSQTRNMDRIPIHILNEFKRTFQYHKDISAIYFDHKIADSVSTFNKIYLLAPLFNCSVKNKRVGFIDGCDAKEIPKDIDIYEFHMDVEKSTNGTSCPPSFYKGILYTMNGKRISMDMQIHMLFGDNTRVRVQQK